MRFRSPAGPRRRAPLLASVALFAALCATATYWALQLLAPPVAIAPSGSLVDWNNAPDIAAASRLFGAVPSAEEAAQAAAAASNIQVVGVAATSSRGSAVLSIDGRPPRAYLAGTKIDEHAKLVEVRPDMVVIEQAGARLELPTPTRPDISLLSAGPSQAAQGGLAAPSGPAAPVYGTLGGPAGGPASQAGAPAAPDNPPVPPYGSEAAPPEQEQPVTPVDPTLPGQAGAPGQGQQADQAANPGSLPQGIRMGTPPGIRGGATGPVPGTPNAAGALGPPPGMVPAPGAMPPPGAPAVPREQGIRGSVDAERRFAQDATIPGRASREG